MGHGKAVKFTWGGVLGDEGVAIICCGDKLIRTSKRVL
jgi:hypothetical protein